MCQNQFCILILCCFLLVDIAKKRAHMAKKKKCFIKKTHPVTSQSKLHGFNFELLPHPPYSADIPSIDYRKR
ncbi:hypothetical protein GWI33_000235 [Rhynchophorus ferrugineus]|uniref:Secreted protein n=1 Tax=Rhynchophorus ferrugineus TaxID=354439 RepID=A0A834J0G7_RHYFE|nr:hypothetical protein GWI33_000235 [Rhynchophorus ferrugineus]